MKQTITTNHQKYNDFQTDSGCPLGILPNHRPAANGAASSGLVPDSDGVINLPTDSKENRIIRFQRQSIVRKLLPQSRTAKCLCHRMAGTVKVLKSKEHNKCHFADLIICGNVWSCPVCAAKISERRRVELARAVEQHTEAGGSVLLVTFTYSHQREDDLKELLNKQAKAMTWFYQHRQYKELKKRYMKRGRVRALEVNHGQANGWHPHVHELWFLDLNLQDYQVLRSEIFSLWFRACERYGLGLPNEAHGVDVRGGQDAASYISKYGLEDKPRDGWGIESELTKANVKKGRKGSRSPFQLLDDYQEGDKQAGALFAEYVEAFKGKRQLIWSRGLKAQFDLDELTDDEIAHQQDDQAELIAEIEAEDWAVILKTTTPTHDTRAIVLHLAEFGGAQVMGQFITDLVARYKQSH